MSIEYNKEIVVLYFDLTAKNDFEGTFDLMSEDFVLYGMGMTPLAYKLTKNEIKDSIKSVISEIAEPLLFTILGITAEGNRVAVEAERHTKLQNGGTYDNQYHFLFVIKDGLICQIKEYLCTYTLHKYFESNNATQKAIFSSPS